MKRAIQAVLLCATSTLSGCLLAVGEPPAVDYSVFEHCGRYINGSQFNLPFGGPSIGFIAPGDIPEESKVRLGVHLGAYSTIRFTSNEFQLYSKEGTSPLREMGVVFNNPGQPAEESVSKAFFETGELHNSLDSERMYLIHVFTVSSLPREFIVRVPNIKVWGITFRAPDFAFKYFPDRNAIGLCSK